MKLKKCLLYVSESNELTEVTNDVDEYGMSFAKFKRVPYGNQFVAQLVPSDGNCFFYALAHQLKMPLKSAGHLRQEAVDFIRRNADRMVCIYLFSLGFLNIGLQFA